MVSSLEQQLKTPQAYLDEPFIKRLQKDKKEIPRYKLQHACELAEPRFIEILNPHEQAYQDGTILTQNSKPVAILKDYYQQLLIPFENNTHPEGVYWLNKEIYKEIEKQRKPFHTWNTYEIPALDIFPVRPFQGNWQQTLRESLEEEYMRLIR